MGRGFEPHRGHSEVYQTDEKPLKINDFQRFFFFTPVPVRRKITSQLPELDWYDAIGDTTVADAILDRIVHTTHRITLTGESVRKLKAFKGK